MNVNNKVKPSKKVRKSPISFGRVAQYAAIGVLVTGVFVFGLPQGTLHEWAGLVSLCFAVLATMIWSTK